MPQTFAPLVSAAIDGRTENVYHRQTQLEALYKVFQDEATSIQDAIITDQGYPTAEAASEYYATVRCIREAYRSLDPAKCLEEEYAIAKGRNSPKHRRPVGIVYIEPTRHTFFFSVVSPLVSAITAGSCVVVLLQRNLTTSNSLIRRLLTSALEQDTFAIAEEPVTNELPVETTIHVLQEKADRFPRLNELVSLSAAPVVALVDRTADVSSAAQALVTARFAFGGKSPYAPDVVAVNEFVQQDFLHAVVNASVGYGGERAGTSKTAGKRAAPSKVEDALNHLRKTSDSFRVVVQNDDFAVVEATSEETLFNNRLQAPILVVQPIRSMDDGIELFNRRVSSICSAAYYFSNQATGKYLCQFIPSEASFVNQLPDALFLGPVSPIGHPIDLAHRYPTELFTVPAAQYVAPSSESASFATLLHNNDKSAQLRLAEESRQPLGAMKRSGGGGIGFFEQGLLLHVGLILTGFVTVSVASVVYARRLFS